jgi:hydrogenase-4 component B
VLAASTIENVGLIAVGIGVALIARAADQPILAALAMGGALLHAINHGVFKTLLFLCAGSAQHGGGSRAMDRLGGLIHRMPYTTACVLAGCLGLAALPPGSGFASEWMMFQAVLGAPRIGGLALQMLLVAAACLMAMAAALAAAAAVRLIGVVFLGRPRTPLGLLPGPVVRWLGPALRLTVGTAMNEQTGLAAIRPASGVAGYAAPAIAVLIGLALALALLALRRWAVAGHRQGPAWANGFAAAPAWLPFGDPLTQYGAASFSQPLRRALGASLLAAREQVDMPAPGDTRPASLHVGQRDPAMAYLFTPIARLRTRVAALADFMQFLTIRRTLSVMFVALILFLTIIAVVESR